MVLQEDPNLVIWVKIGSGENVSLDRELVCAEDCRYLDQDFRNNRRS